MAISDLWRKKYEGWWVGYVCTHRTLTDIDSSYETHYKHKIT